MKNFFCLTFILIFLFSCAASSTKKINPTNNLDNKSKTDVTFSATVKSGICIYCNE